MRILVVGCGGVGSWLTEGLARMLEYRVPDSALLLVDGDSYEPKNKERQVFSQMGNKAEVRASELAPLFERTTIAPIGRWVVEEQPAKTDEEYSTKIAISSLMEDGDVVFAAVDNFSARKIIFDYASLLDNVDVLTGGNNDEYEFSIYHYQRRDGLDITDHPSFWHEEFVNPPDKNPGSMSCQERAMQESGTQLIATNMVVASYLLARFVQLLNGVNPVKASEIFGDLALGVTAAYHRDAAEVPETVSV